MFVLKYSCLKLMFPRKNFWIFKGADHIIFHYKANDVSFWHSFFNLFRSGTIYSVHLLSVPAYFYERYFQCCWSFRNGSKIISFISDLKNFSKICERLDDFSYVCYNPNSSDSTTWSRSPLFNRFDAQNSLTLRCKTFQALPT